LVATLLDTRRPLTLEEIVELVPGYPDDKLSYRRQFERDKDTLRGIGIPVRLESVDGLGPEQGYRVPPDEYYLPPLDLTADEQAALHVAVTAVRLEGGPAPTEALWKLGGREGEAAHALAALPTVPALPALFDAYQAAAVVDQVDEAAVKERRDDGGVVLELPVTNTAAFLSFVLGLLDAAEVVAPPELRAEMVDWLDRIARGAA